MGGDARAEDGGVSLGRTAATFGYPRTAGNVVTRLGQESQTDRGIALPGYRTGSWNFVFFKTSFLLAVMPCE